MKNQFPEINQSHNHDNNRQLLEMQRRFVTLQSKRSQLEHELRTINALLFSLGKDMGQYFSYEQLYK